MPVMGYSKFERFFRAASGVDVDRNDVKRFLDFVNQAIYDLLLAGQPPQRRTAATSLRARIWPSPPAYRRPCTSSASSTKTLSSRPSWTT